MNAIKLYMSCNINKNKKNTKATTVVTVLDTIIATTSNNKTNLSTCTQLACLGSIHKHS